MSGVNLDTLSDEQWEEWIAGCQVLRKLRDHHVNADRRTPSPAPKVVLQPTKKNTKEPA